MAIVVGVSSLAFMIGFFKSFIVVLVNNGINADYSHIQIHHPEFKKDYETRYTVPNPDDLRNFLSKQDSIKAVSSRVIVNGMVASAKAANGVAVYGIDPLAEGQVTRLDSSLIEGGYFQNIKRNPILISYKLAENLKVKLRSKVVITVQNVDGNVISGAFRVEGIFETKSPRINEMVVYVRDNDLRELLGLEGGVHEVALLLDHDDAETPLSTRLSSQFPGYLVESWRSLAPELDMMQSQMGVSMTAILIIIMGALCFGIVNTMLMAVLERVKELGMLMAVGMKKSRVFMMIVIETLFMAGLGAPIGIVIGLAINTYFENTGIDLTAYSDGLKDYGYDTIFYPSIAVSDYVMIAMGVGLTAILASVYPARKATKLKPIEALHTI